MNTRLNRGWDKLYAINKKNYFIKTVIPVVVALLLAYLSAHIVPNVSFDLVRYYEWANISADLTSLSDILRFFFGRGEPLSMLLIFVAGSTGWLWLISFCSVFICTLLMWKIVDKECTTSIKRQWLVVVVIFIVLLFKMLFGIRAAMAGVVFCYFAVGILERGSLRCVDYLTLLVAIALHNMMILPVAVIVVVINFRYAIMRLLRSKIYLAAVLLLAVVMVVLKVILMLGDFSSIDVFLFQKIYSYSNMGVPSLSYGLYSLVNVAILISACVSYYALPRNKTKSRRDAFLLVFCSITLLLSVVTVFISNRMVVAILPIAIPYLLNIAFRSRECFKFAIYSLLFTLLLYNIRETFLSIYLYPISFSEDIATTDYEGQDYCVQKAHALQRHTMCSWEDYGRSIYKKEDAKVLWGIDL